MKLKTGLVAGAAVGYYLGAKAGRRRYEQLSRALRVATRSSALRGVVSKARAVADLGAERVRGIFGEELHDDAASSIVPLDSRRTSRSKASSATTSSEPNSAGERRYW